MKGMPASNSAANLRQHHQNGADKPAYSVQKVTGGQTGLAITCPIQTRICLPHWDFQKPAWSGRYRACQAVSANDLG